jgi:hypothetical protein
LLFIFSLWCCTSAEASPAAGPSDSGPVDHLKSIVCIDRTAGVEFPPLGICFDMMGDLFVVDSDNSRIYAADPSMDGLTLFSECPDDYQGCDFVDLAGSEAGGLYASERSYGSILEFDRMGDLRGFAEVGDGVAGIGGGKSGLVYVAMSICGSIRMVDLGTETGVLETSITRGDGNAYPVDCRVFKGGRVIVTDSSSRQVFFLSELGELMSVARGFDFKSPFGVTCVGDSLILVSDSEKGLVAVFDFKGDFLYSFGDGILEVPTFLDATPDGLVCVSDTGKMTIEVFKLGEVSTE